MGTKTSIESTTAIFVAYRQKRVWTQAQLAKEVDVTVKTLRRWLVAMRAAGVPLESEEDIVGGSRQVYWSMRRNWYPEGVLVAPETLAAVCEHLGWAPEAPGRDELLHLLRGMLGVEGSAGAWSSGELSATEEAHLSLIEKALAGEQALEVLYSSKSSDERERVVTVCQIARGIPVRFLVFDHEAKDYRRFRLDGVKQVRLSSLPAMSCDPHEVEQIMGSMADGFHDGSASIEHQFLVRYPEAHWVASNLLPGMKPKRTKEGLLVTARVSATTIVARFVVGLGAAATPLTEELLTEVERLATGALSRVNELTVAKPDN